MKPLHVLCINPWIYDFAAYDFWSKPLGLLYVAGYLQSRGVEVSLIDCLDKYHPGLLKRQGRQTAKISRYGIGPFHKEVVDTPDCISFMPRKFARYGLPEDLFIKDLHSSEKPDAIFVTTAMTYWYPGPQRVIELCRQELPDVPIIIGGIYATLMPDHVKSALKPDHLLTGPGEVQAAELLAEIFDRPELSGNHPQHIDDFPYPLFELYEQLGYLVVMSSRGCPFRCTFCATYKIDSAFSQRQPDAVVKEILDQTRKFQVRDVAFYDDALLMQPEKRIKPILREIRDSQRPLRFHTPNGLHARYIDEELAKLMYDCNFKTVRLSLESVAKERRRDIHNKITPGEMTRAVKHLTNAGFQASDLETYIIMGLPGQPVDEVLETILYANSLGIRVRLASFSPIPGTKDYERAIERGDLPAGADPLLTNKTVIPLERTSDAYQRYHAVSQFSHMLNEGARRGVNFFRPGEFKDNFFKALARTAEW